MSPFGNCLRWLGRGAALGLALIVLARPALAQEEKKEDDVEKQARRARQGAGLRVGIWAVQDLPAATDDSKWPIIEGYFQKGIDLHLVNESSAALWRWQGTTQSGGGLTPVTTDEVAVYVIPLMTALKFYPATRPGDPLEPYLLAGVGFAFGVEDSDSGTGIAQGFGFKAGSGLDWRLSPAFALTLGARYQWLKFFEGDPGGMETFKGFGFDAGLTYRFQYQ